MPSERERELGRERGGEGGGRKKEKGGKKEEEEKKKKRKKKRREIILTGPILFTSLTVKESTRGPGSDSLKTVLQPGAGENSSRQH